MAGNMNTGLIICRLVAEDTGNVVEKAKATLSLVQIAFDRHEGRLPLFDMTGKSVWTVFAESDDAGVAFVEFLWDPLEYPYFHNSDWSPPSVITARNPDRGDALEITKRGFLSDTKVKRSFVASEFVKRMHFCINLKQAVSSGKGQFQFDKSSSRTIDTLKLIQRILEFRAKIKGEKIPKLQLLRVAGVTPEMISLLGAVEIKMKPV